MTTQEILQGVHDWTNGKIVYDISAAHPDGQGNPTPYADLTAALGTGGVNIPEDIRKGGMSIKFIQGTINYTVVKIEGVTEEPTGTEIQNDPSIESGTYKANQLSAFSALPTTPNSSLTYYLAVTETVDEQEVTTYTTWVITYVQSSDNKYVQYFLTKDEWSIVEGDWEKTNLCDEVNQLNQNISNSFSLEDTDNIFDPKDVLSEVYKFKINSQSKFVSSNWHYIFCLPYEVAQGEKLCFKHFADLPIEGSWRIIGLDIALGDILPVSDGTVNDTGSSNFTNQRGYVNASQNANYIYICVSVDGIPAPNAEFARKMLEKLSIVKADSYPNEYIAPHIYKVGVPNLNEDVINLIPKTPADIHAVGSHQGSENAGKFLAVGLNGIVGLVPNPGGGGATIDDAVIRRESITYPVSNSILTEEIVLLGTNWSGTIATGFQHSSGSVEPLVFNINTDSGAKYIVSFDLSNAMESSIFVSLGNSAKVDIYNGTNHVDVGFYSDGGRLSVIPATSSTTVTISNIKLRKIVPQETADESITININNVDDGTLQNNVSGFWNIGIGPMIGGPLSANENGSRNIAIGLKSLGKLKSGTRNIAIGTFSMPWNTEGDRNIAIGADTLYDAPEFMGAKSYDCIAIGKGAMRAGSDLQYNIAIGNGAMAYCGRTTKQTVAIGFLAGNYAANNNVHIGYRAGYYTKGTGNVSLGYGALSDVYNTGDNNVCLGYNSGILSPTSGSDNIMTINNAIAIGANVHAVKSNQVVIGNSYNDEFILGNKKLKFNNDNSVTWETVS